MEISDTSGSIEQVIKKIGQVLVSKNNKMFKNEQQIKEQIQQLQKKQKNLNYLHIKEQLKLDKLSKEIDELQDNSLTETTNQINNLKNIKLGDLKSEIAKLSSEVQNGKTQQNLYDQQIEEAKEYLENAKQNLNQKFGNLSHFEVELESCGKQLEFLKKQCDEKIIQWENIRNQTKQQEKIKEDMKTKIKQKQIEIEKEKQSRDKNLIQVQLYNQLEEKLIKQIEANQEKTDDMLGVNTTLEQRYSEVSEKPHELKKLLRISNQMLKEKNLLLEQQIQKIQKQQQIVSQSQTNLSLKLRSTSQFSDMQSDISSQYLSSMKKYQQNNSQIQNGNIFFNQINQFGN